MIGLPLALDSWPSKKSKWNNNMVDEKRKNVKLNEKLKMERSSMRGTYGLWADVQQNKRGLYGLNTHRCPLHLLFYKSISRCKYDKQCCSCLLAECAEWSSAGNNKFSRIRIFIFSWHFFCSPNCAKRRL